jgi:hypothetical protein
MPSTKGKAPTVSSLAEDVHLNEMCTCGHTSMEHYWDNRSRKPSICSWCDCKQFTIAVHCPTCKQLIEVK